MKLNGEKFIGNLKKVVEKTGWQASSGQACALASIMTIKQGMFDSLGNDVKSPELKFVENELDELAKEIANPKSKLMGFASNASAAAKAAGFEKVDVMAKELGDLMAI